MPVPMNPVLAEMLATRTTRAADGSVGPLHSNVTAEEGAFLQEHVAAVRPDTSVEVGLAYGTSAMFVCDQLAALGHGTHVAFDPMQAEWGDQGLVNLSRAGHDERFEFVRKPAHLGLAAFEEAGRRAQFAFVDGYHTFDHTLVDFFHADRVLDAGGVLAIDDAHMPPVTAAVAFVLSNRAYELVGAWPAPGRTRRKAPLPEGVRCVALRKLRDDDRPWDAYVPFWTGR